MIKIQVNKFNTLEYEPHKINEVNDRDRYFDVYLSGRSVEDEERVLVYEIKINLKDRKKTMIKTKKKGVVIHPNVLLSIDKFISNYKDE